MTGSPSLRDLRILGEAFIAVVITWLLLGWSPDRAIPQLDGSQLVAPYVRGALAAGPDWSHYLYRFGVIGGSEMHPFGGTMPIVQVFAALGASTTTTLNAIVWFVQIAYAYLAIVIIESLASAWAGAPVRLGGAARVVAVWLCAFAPVVGWRIATGHDNLLLGLLPFLATFALVLAAGAGRLTATMLVAATFAVANGVSGLGAQTVVYGAVFGAPLAVAALLTAPRGARWDRAHWQAIAALAAGVLLVVPRMVSMAAHATGDDATRGLGATVVYSYGRSSWRDWLASIPWTTQPAAAVAPTVTIERNFPFGPIAMFALALWPRGTSRRLGWAALIAAALAIILADDIAPLSTAVLRALPPLRAFRVPSRAILPLAIAAPALALAAWTAAASSVSATGAPAARASWLAIAGAAALVLVGRAVPTWPREALAWLACGALVLAARRYPDVFERRMLAVALAPVAALGVLAFEERLPHGVPYDAIETGPARVHDAVIAQVPEAAMPLARVEIVDPPEPYARSEAWAAGLGSLDGLWYPPRRFLDLMSALRGQIVPPTTSNFEMWRQPEFPIYQQMYDVVAEVQLTGESGAVLAMPAPAGPAWFPSRIEGVSDGAAMVARLRAAGADVHALVAGTAWIVATEAVQPPMSAADPACAHAAVRGVTTDDDGQIATIGVDAPADCVLIVATTYVSTLRAEATFGAAGSAAPREAPVFPVDIALTGIAVPRGASAITLAPVADVPAWSRALELLGALALAGALAAPLVGRRVTAGR